MTLLLVIVGLVAVGYVAVNLGSKGKTPLLKIAVSMAVVCLVAYFVYPYFAPLFTHLMQLSPHL